MNHIQIYDNVLSKESCHEIIQYLETSPDTVMGKIGKGIDLKIKHSTDISIWMNKLRNESEYNITANIINTLNIGIKKYINTFPFLEEIERWDVSNVYNIQRFNEGQGYYKMHCEYNALDNNRVLAWMIYLNNAKCGTRFYYPQRDIKAKRGRLVIWPADWTYPHSGITPNKGVKYIATGWYSH